MLSEHDLYLLAEGTFQRPYERLGAHPLTRDGVAGTRFAVWAPNAVAIAVRGDFDGWTEGGQAMTRRGTTGIWEAFVPGAGPGQHYKYRLIPRGPGTPADKADPYALCGEAPPGTASVIHDLATLRAFPWTDGDWMAGRPRRQGPDRPLSIYEVHPGSWRARPGGGQPAPDLPRAGPDLPPYVRDLGYTHVELMPVTEYPSDASWGYLVSGYYAPTARYGVAGGPQAFRGRLPRPRPGGAPGLGAGALRQGGARAGPLRRHAPLRAPRPAHRASTPSGVPTSSTTAGPRCATSCWGAPASGWRSYHVDGFRVDAVASMIWLDHARPESHWGLNRHGGRENLDAVEFLRRLNAMVHECAPGAITVAEESTAYPWVTHLPGEPERASLGFDFKWNMGWMHDTLEYFQADPVHRSARHERLTWPIWYAFDEQYLLPLSHDEVVHLKKALLTKMPGDDWQRFANLRALYAYQYAHPGKKLLFMGGELGQWGEWSEGRSLDWHLLEAGGEGGARPPCTGGYRPRCVDLNRLYGTLSALHQLDSQPRGFDWIEHGDVQHSVIAFLRRGLEPGDVVAAVCNFTPVVREGYPVGVPVPGEWEEVLNTDSARYGGSGTGNTGASLLAVPGQRSGRFGQHLRLTLPPLSVLYLRPREE